MLWPPAVAATALLASTAAGVLLAAQSITSSEYALAWQHPKLRDDMQRAECLRRYVAVKGGQAASRLHLLTCMHPLPVEALILPPVQDTAADGILSFLLCPAIDIFDLPCRTRRKAG